MILKGSERFGTAYLDDILIYLITARSDRAGYHAGKPCKTHPFFFLPFPSPLVISFPPSILSFAPSYQSRKSQKAPSSLSSAVYLDDIMI